MLTPGDAYLLLTAWQPWNQFEWDTIGGVSVLNQDFKEFLELLRRHSVRYLIVGGYSVAIHGHPRYTKDLDVWIFAESGNATRLLAALDDFGFASLELKEEDFTVPGYVIQLGQPPIRIDLLTSLTGVEFEQCWNNKLTLDLDGMDLPFISLEDLKTNKQALGRHQDLADLENLSSHDDQS